MRSPESPGNGLADRTYTSNDVRPTTEMSKFTNRYLEDGSYLSIRNIQLSYTFDKKMLRKTFLNGLVLSFNIDNLHTFTKYTGMNLKPTHSVRLPHRASTVPDILYLEISP